MRSTCTATYGSKRGEDKLPSSSGPDAKAAFLDLLAKLIATEHVRRNATIADGNTVPPLKSQTDPQTDRRVDKGTLERSSRRLRK